MMLLLLETGIRTNEFVSINLKDVKIEESVIHERNAKGNQERIVPITSAMMKQLKKYISIRGYVETDALFITLDRKPVIEIRNIREEGG
ncbi:site-specific integrase [Bacillus haynesii]|nr:site-specific integrase [Bacillus haynesii]MCY8347574.1 site-specific integrase [Bacillus haynesii]MCY8351138.1 site-specific integrase [Bacillus haynesii]MCY8559889.1 site-specific integrase [Bacillus haynesii]MCY8758260.1 site-specific integrase [Bacillus haynesii]